MLVGTKCGQNKYLILVKQLSKIENISELWKPDALLLNAVYLMGSKQHFYYTERKTVIYFRISISETGGCCYHRSDLML